jgi:hypothetical protein
MNIELFDDAYCTRTRIEAAAADRRLDPDQRAIVQAAWRAGHLRRDAAIDPLVDGSWRAASVWGLRPAIYTQALSAEGTIVVLDVEPLGARLTAEGRAAIRALFAAVAPPGPYNLEIGPVNCAATIRTDRVRHACRRLGQIIRECSDYLEPASPGGSEGPRS